MGVDVKVGVRVCSRVVIQGLGVCLDRSLNWQWLNCVCSILEGSGSILGLGLHGGYTRFRSPLQIWDLTRSRYKVLLDS